jgi:hypothetical protein
MKGIRHQQDRLEKQTKSGTLLVVDRSDPKYTRL